MLTTRFVFLGFALLSAKSASSEPYLGECCPMGKIYFESSELFCTFGSKREVHLLYPNNTDAGIDRGFLLECFKLEDIVITTLDDYVPDEQVPACFDTLDEQKPGMSGLIVIQCRSNKDRQTNESSSQITYIRKCCKNDTIFDSRTKACVSQLNNAPSLLPNETFDEDRVVIASEGPPKCEGPIVDYEIDEYDASLRNDTYSAMIPISNHSNSIVKEEYFVTKDNACFDMTPHSASSRSMIVRVCRDREYCDRNACIRKCCAEDELFYARECRKRNMTKGSAEFHPVFASAVNATQSSTFDTTKDYGVLIGKPCLYGMYPVNPTEEKWSLTSQGHVKVENYPTYNLDHYCMDVYYNKSHYSRGFYLFICFEKPGPGQNVKTSYKVNTVLEFTSCAFLLITLLVYVCLPSLQNLHGKTLMCHVSSLLFAFTCLAVIPWITPGVALNIKELRVTILCKALAYTMLFCFLSAFSWLNVMCFDIWWTFGGLRGDTITRGRKHRRRFLLYCLYAWGFSFLVSILAIIFDYTDTLPMYLRPNVGYTSCWFAQLAGLYGEMIFFIGPVTIQLISNVVFFVLTSMHCNQVKAEIKRVTSDPADPRSKRFHSDRNRFVMNIKLFIVMGISWICEVVSFFLKRYNLEWQDTIFYFSDVFNCLQGLLIFILFVLKSRVYLALRRRLGLDVRKKRACNNTTTLQDPYRVRKSASNSTITSTFAVSLAP